MALLQVSGGDMALLNDQPAYEEQDRSRWLWILAAILLLLLLSALGWFWWNGSKSAAAPLVAKAATASAATPKAFNPPPASYGVLFGYHESTIQTNEALSDALDAWRSYNNHQCGQACSCQTSARIDIVGHADRRTGTLEFNKCISWKRAMVVADSLANLGVPRCDISLGFVGALDLPTPEADEATAAKHRYASIGIATGNAPPWPSCIGACKSSLSSSEAESCEAKLKQPPLLHLK